MQNLTKQWKQSPAVILQQTTFYDIFILCFCGEESSEYPIKVFTSWIFLHRYFFNFHFIWLWFLIAIMKRCAEQCTLQLYRTSLSIFILFQLQGWLILRVRTKFRNFHTKRVIMEIAMMKILNNCVSGRLNNNYFPLNESSSHY